MVKILKNELVDRNIKVLHEETKDPTQELWKQVLKQAFEDAFMPRKLHLCDYEKREARDFVSKRSENFDRVCEMAGLSPDYVWDKVKQFRKEKLNEFGMVG
jgi:hypothetical protein